MFFEPFHYEIDYKNQFIHLQNETHVVAQFRIPGLTSSLVVSFAGNSKNIDLTDVSNAFTFMKAFLPLPEK